MVPSSRSNYQLLHKIFLKHHSLIICFHQESRCPRIFTMNFNAFHVLCFCHKVYNKISFERGARGERGPKDKEGLGCAVRARAQKGLRFFIFPGPFLSRGPQSKEILLYMAHFCSPEKPPASHKNPMFPQEFENSFW